MTITTESAVGQLVADRPSRARVFEKLGIDYCCGGRQPLSEACSSRGLDAATVLRLLEAIDEAPATPQADWSRATMSELADHIEQTHHAYLKQELPRLHQLLEKIAAKHGDSRPALRELLEVFLAFAEELFSHMAKEERILFPLIRQLESAGGPAAFHCGSIRNPIAVMVAEHDNAGRALQRMRELTDGYAAPADACNTYRASFDALRQLEADMHQHVHKENNILFPRATQAETRTGQA
jgi:regulator of cell morphogenesis and NO signaling